MFRKAELDRLHCQKQLLLMECDVYRLRLTRDLERLNTPDFWVGEAVQVAQRHPLWTAVLGLGAGMTVVNALRQPKKGPGIFGKLGDVLSAGLSAWDMFKGKKPDAKD